MKKIIIGNLKMNLLTIAERDRYLESFGNEIKNKNFLNSEIVICPPSFHFEKFAEKFKKSIVAVGGQNIFSEERGSYTGETSASMVKNFGGQFAIIGHSERRRIFGETNELINAKIKTALKNNLIPIFCIGETQKEKEDGKIGDVFFDQLTEGLNSIGTMSASKIILAYEPVWAIGTDKSPSSDEILGAKILIKKILSKLYSQSVCEKIRIIYGGSVNAKIVDQVCIEPEMDGVLVGRESLIPNEFIKIVEIIDRG